MQLKTRKRIILLALLILNCTASHGQFLDAASGLLQMPSADMGPAGTVMFTCNFLNQHTTPPAWSYNTFNYGISIVFFSRLEVGYVPTFIYKDNYYIAPSIEGLPPEYVELINQDRHLYVKVLLLKEGDFGKSWIPALAIGVNDPTTGDVNKYKDIDYINFDVISGNGFFNRYYVVATKHFSTPVGTLGAHLGYQYNRRHDLPYNGPCAALDWEPVWFQKDKIISTKLIAEYDSHTFNIGFIASLWKDHIEIMAELQALRWFSGGIRFKTVLF